MIESETTYDDNGEVEGLFALVTLGTGDIGVGTGRSRRRLVMRQLDESYPIGTKVKINQPDEPRYQVCLEFEDAQSVVVVQRYLELIKARFFEEQDRVALAT